MLQLSIRLPRETLQKLRDNHQIRRQELQKITPDYNYTLQDYIREVLDDIKQLKK